MKAQLLLLALLTPFLRLAANDTLPPPDPAYTQLHRAADRGELEYARELLRDARPSAALNQVDREGFTPLDYAARAGSAEIVRLLIDAGAAVNRAEAGTGWTALLHAAEQRHAEAARCLLDHGANPNARTARGKTPLAAALAGTLFPKGPVGDRDATVRALLAKGADPALLLEAFDRQATMAQPTADGRQRFEEEYRRLRAEIDRLNALIAQIRTTVGDPGARPTTRP